MSSSNLKKTLERKYASVLGGVATAQASDQAVNFKEALAAIQIVIRLWEPDWTPDHIKPIRPKRQYAPHGEQSKLLFTFLKNHRREFSTEDAASYLERELIARRFEVPPLLNRKSYCYQFLTGLEGKGLVVKVSSRPSRWRKLSH